MAFDPLTILGIGATLVGSAAAANAAEALGTWLRRLTLTPAEAETSGDDGRDPDSLTGTIAAIRQRDYTLEERLTELANLMERSTILSEQVSAELEARAATARRLQEEAKQAEELASINREQAEAIRKLMDTELAAKLSENSKAIRKDVRKDSIRIGVGSFIAGGGLTLFITLLVHPLH